METKIDGKNEFVTKLVNLIPKIVKFLGKNRTQAMDWLGNRLGYDSGRKQVYLWLKEKEDPANAHTLLMQLEEIEHELEPVIKPVVPIPQPRTESLGIESLMDYVIDLAVKYGELKNEVERHKILCDEFQKNEKTLERHGSNRKLFKG